MKKIKKDGYSFSKILDMWLNNKKYNVKIQTYQKYERLIELHITNLLGNIEIKKISNKIILEYFCLEEISKLSISVKKTLLGIIKNALELAYLNNYCNFINLQVKFKANKRNDLLVFSKREYKKMDMYARTDMNEKKLMLLIVMYTGIRIGEACGLKWSDINLTRKTININRTVQRIRNNDLQSKLKTKLIVSLPKSESSIRTIPISNYLIPYLKKFYKKDGTYVLTGTDKIYDERTYETFYKRLLKACNVSYLKFHCLRHSFATNSIASGVDVKTLSEILGHSSVEITLKLYVHPTFNMKKRSIEKVTKYIKG